MSKRILIPCGRAVGKSTDIARSVLMQEKLRRTEDWHVHKPPMDKCSNPRVYRNYFEHHCPHCVQEELDGLLYDPIYYAVIAPLHAHTKGLFKLHRHSKYHRVAGSWVWRREFLIETPVLGHDDFWRPAFAARGLSVEDAVRQLIATTEAIP